MRIQTTIAMVLLLAMSGQLSAQTRPATTLPTDPALLKQFRERTSGTLSLKPKVEYHKLSDVMESRMENGVIQLTRKIASINSPIRLELDDLPGISAYAGSGDAFGISNVCPSEMGFSTVDISISRGWVQITVSDNTTSQRRNCSLTQNSRMPDGGRSISLSVYRADSRGKVLSQKQYAGDNLEDLRRRNPEAEEDLRAMLHRLGLEHLLAAESRLAWQVFAGDLEPRPEIVVQVAALVKQLDADDFLERDDAVVKLRALGAPGMLAMMRTDRKTLSLEQQLRLESALKPYSSLSPQLAKSRRDDVVFLLDCLMCDDSQIRPLALARLKQIAGREITFDVDAPLAARVQALAEVRQALKSTTSRPAKLAVLAVPVDIGAAPKIDGVLDDAVWTTAASTTLFKTSEGMDPSVKTRLLVTQDKDTIYVAVECTEKAGTDKLVAGFEGHDEGGIWQDDDVELFIDPTNKRQSYYQIIVNPKGATWDAYHAAPDSPDTSWEPKYQSAVKIGKESWVVEFALPLAIFNRTATSTDTWAFNVRRGAQGVGESIYFSPPAGPNAHDPAGFGTLTGIKTVWKDRAVEAPPVGG